MPPVVKKEFLLVKKEIPDPILPKPKPKLKKPKQESDDSDFDDGKKKKKGVRYASAKKEFPDDLDDKTKEFHLNINKINEE